MAESDSMGLGIRVPEAPAATSAGHTQWVRLRETGSAEDIASVQ